MKTLKQRNVKSFSSLHSFTRLSMVSYYYCNLKKKVLYVRTADLSVSMVTSVLTGETGGTGGGTRVGHLLSVDDDLLIHISVKKRNNSYDLKDRETMKLCLLLIFCRSLFAGKKNILSLTAVT